jgi:GNAT superfamily N-acetyltransferase
MLSHDGSIVVRAISRSDIDVLETIVRQHVRDLHTHEVVESEVQAIIEYMGGATDPNGHTRQYLVACDNSDIPIGCMAVAIPDQDMLKHFNTAADNSVELLNAFVSQSYYRGKGVGRRLFEAACTCGRALGADYLLVNSGPRYQNSWGFYDRVCDNEHGFIDHKYGPGRHAKTWKKILA